MPQAAGGVARFGFLDLCGHPLGAADYMALARRFHTVFVTSIPAMSMQVCDLLCALAVISREGPADKQVSTWPVKGCRSQLMPSLGKQWMRGSDLQVRDQARRFITLIDEMYNARTRLVCSAACAPDDLFSIAPNEQPLLDLESLQFETAVEGAWLSHMQHKLPALTHACMCFTNRQECSCLSTASSNQDAL